MDIKKAYHRFKQWQLDPFEHEFHSHQSQHCQNCGHDFVGNFCPYCSQRQGLGPITWRSVGKSIAEVWGMHNRSLVYSLMQLFLRPGYFISDYISGKRQVSFPPVKMLAIVAVLGVIVDFLTGAIHGMINVGSNERMAYISNVFSWLNDHLNGAFPPPSDYLNDVFLRLNTHPDVLSLTLLCFLIIPNYFIFRFAPRNTRHTLPQGFFIQVFSTAVFMILNMVYDVTSLGWFVVTLGMVMVFITYKQLFGYGVWGTLWRVVMAFVCAITSLSILLNINYGFHLLREQQVDAAKGFFLNVPIALLILAVILWVCYIVSKPRQAKQKTASALTLLLAGLILSLLSAHGIQETGVEVFPTHQIEAVGQIRPHDVPLPYDYNGGQQLAAPPQAPVVVPTHGCRLLMPVKYRTTMAGKNNLRRIANRLCANLYAPLSPSGSLLVERVTSPLGRHPAVGFYVFRLCRLLC